MQVPSLAQEDPLEKEMQPTPVFLPGKFQTEEPGGPQSMGSQKVRQVWATEHAHTNKFMCTIFLGSMSKWYHICLSTLKSFEALIFI